MSSGVVVLYYRIYSRIFATLLQDAHACNATQACHMQWCRVWLEFWEEGNKTIQQAFSCGQSCYSDPPHGMRARACCFSLDLHCYSSEVHSPARGQRQRAKLNHRKRERENVLQTKRDGRKEKKKGRMLRGCLDHRDGEREETLAWVPSLRMMWYCDGIWRMIRLVAGIVLVSD